MNDSDPTSRSPTRPRLRGRVRRWVAPVLWGLVVAIAFAFPLLVRVVWEGRAELRAAEQARVRYEPRLEIEHLGRAARWRCPGADHDEQALRRLQEIAVARERHGEDEEALMAYREIRRALLATRAWGVPHPGLFAAANREIARLQAAAELRFSDADPDDVFAVHLARLERVPGPDPTRANLAASAFVAWLVATGLLLGRGLTADGVLRPAAAVRWGLLGLLLLIAWATLLRLA